VGADIPTSSDSAVIGYWYDQAGKITNAMIDAMDGIFAFVLVDERTGHYIVARDPLGICPLYWGTAADGATWFASELKALHDVCETFDIFPPVRGPAACTGAAARGCVRGVALSGAACRATCSEARRACWSAGTRRAGSQTPPTCPATPWTCSRSTYGEGWQGEGLGWLGWAGQGREDVQRRSERCGSACRAAQCCAGLNGGGSSGARCQCACRERRAARCYSALFCKRWES